MLLATSVNSKKKNILKHKFHIRMKRQVPSAFKSDNKEARVTASAAAKVIEDFPNEDAEILRLIEERRSTPKEEKQRLKDLSKCIKKCIREKKRMKRQQDIQRILEDFKGVPNIPGIKSAKKKVLITKIKNDKGECITS